LSTTHISYGSIIGIGLVNRRWGWKTIGQMLTVWVTTLPLRPGLGLGAGTYWLMG